MKSSVLKSPASETVSIMGKLGVPHRSYLDGTLQVFSPITGEIIGHAPETDRLQAEAAIAQAHAAFLVWRTVPAPKRGELLRLFAEELRGAKNELGRLVSIETGKIV